MSPGAPRATAMMPKMSGDKLSIGGAPTPRSIDLGNRVGKAGRQVRWEDLEARLPHVYSQGPGPALALTS